MVLRWLPVEYLPVLRRAISKEFLILSAQFAQHICPVVHNEAVVGPN